MQQIKTLIRRGEARAAGRYCGVPGRHLHFLDMPFYETGTVRKKPLGAEDIAIIVELLERVKPHQIYAAGDLSDPHGTHRVCLAAIFRALHRRVKKPADGCEGLRGLALPRRLAGVGAASRSRWPCRSRPDEVERKRTAIFKHQSQKDRAHVPRPDDREFWQRAEDRNAHTARLYDKLGLPEYEAIEGFVRWDGRPLD